MDSAQERTPPAKDVPHETCCGDAASRDVRVRRAPVRCPYCHDEIGTQDEAWVACAGCLARHHAACWTASRKCATCNDRQSLVGAHAAPRPSRFLHVLKAIGFAFLLAFMGLAAYTGYRVLTIVHAIGEQATATGHRVRALVDREAERDRGPSPEDAEAANLRAAASRHYLGETQHVVALRLRAGEGDADAMYDLAQALETADGVSPDKEAARDWYLRAGDAGNVQAMMWLGGYYWPGSVGTGRGPSSGTAGPPTWENPPP